LNESEMNLFDYCEVEIWEELHYKKQNC